MVGLHHRLNGPEFAQIPGDSGGQRSLVCDSPWGHKEPDMTSRLDSNSMDGCGLVLMIPPGFPKLARSLGCLPKG